jgi:hypothetical protein
MDRIEERPTQERQGNGRQELEERDEELRRVRQTMEEQARRAEHMAATLSREATRQWQRAIQGALALPAAIALTTAARTLYIAAFIERGFEMFHRSAESIRRERREMREDREMAELPH